ncbi:hypothetical protein BRADI_4g19172v3 [Brachypodium distachyon]|uniref:Uncharacterized protein n=1 Tax=Brachypodium distachyon TaxID=15368 RepID=A0A2K2CNP9_BRADI|nr:hypothetical protein BRADI_4g19172v3 [Brachypodium distachyon]
MVSAATAALFSPSHGLLFFPEKPMVVQIDGRFLAGERLYTYALTGSVPGLHFSRTTRLWLHAFSWSERSLVLYQVYTSQGGGQGYGYGCMLSAGASGHGLVLPYMHSDLVFG